MKNLDSLNENPRPPLRPPRVYNGQVPPRAYAAAQPQPRPKKRRLLKFFLGIIVIAIFVMGGWAVSRAINLSNKIFVGQKTTFFKKIKDLVRGGSNAAPLQGENLGQVNILLLGIGGEGHDGPYLTDTMMLAQVRPDLGEVTLTAIPRDLYVDIGHGFGQQKINAAFAQGYYKNGNWNEGGTWAREAVQKISGLTIPYFAVVDFSGFEKAIDQVGGIDVAVDRTFTDYSYPNEKEGYLPPQTFKQGPQHMDGKTALIFARSRHAAGPEGSDFARSQRQQKVINAFKAKTLSLNLITDVSTINGLLGTFADHAHTNLSPAEILRLYTLVKDKNIQQFLSLSLDPDTGIICPQILPDNGAYVLLPCEGKTMSDVQGFFKNSFTTGRLAGEQSVVWLATSTGDKAAYQSAYEKLSDAGLTVWELPYGKPALDQTVVYAANPKPATVEFIKNTLGATEATLPPPNVKVDSTRVDVIVILGKDNNVSAIKDMQ